MYITGRKRDPRIYQDDLYWELCGVYSIAEVVDDSNKRPSKTIFCILDENNQFTKSQLKSLHSVSTMVKENGAKVFNSLAEIANYVN